MSYEGTQQKILVIDDDKVLLQMVSIHLEHWGYRPFTASNGEEGLRLADQEQPALILLDVLMPSMKGREVCAHLKENPKTQKIPVIFLTAMKMPEHIKAGLDHGAEDYIVKPWESEELKERIGVCLMRHSAGPNP